MLRYGKSLVSIFHSVHLLLATVARPGQVLTLSRQVNVLPQDLRRPVRSWKCDVSSGGDLFVQMGHSLGFLQSP